MGAEITGRETRAPGRGGCGRWGLWAARVPRAVDFRAGGALEERVERDDFDLLAQAAEEGGDLLDRGGFAHVHQEEGGTLRVELHKFPEGGDGRRGGAGDVEGVVAADHGAGVVAADAGAGVAVVGPPVGGGDGRGFRGGDVAPVGVVAAAASAMGASGTLSTGGDGAIAARRAHEGGGDGSGGAGECARRKREAQGEDEGGGFRRGEGGSQAGRATGAGT